MGVSSVPDDLHLTDPKQAREFVEYTGVDSLGVNIGQVHVHGRREIHLDLARLVALRKEIHVPLALHGGTSISAADVSEAINLGVRKINLASILKRSYFDGLRQACAQIDGDYNPYEIVGSGIGKGRPGRGSEFTEEDRRTFHVGLSERGKSLIATIVF